MTHAADFSSHDRWPLSRILHFLLAGAFAGLMIDIRGEHVDAVREHSIAWLPIIYSGVMAIGCGASFAIWNSTIRRVMIPLFAVALFIGGLGFYLHNHGDLIQVIKTSVSAWTDPKASHSDEPPQFAPLAFAGLGVIGIVASLKRFNS